MLYFTLVKCVGAGVSLAHVGRVLNQRACKARGRCCPMPPERALTATAPQVTRRPGDAKPQPAAAPAQPAAATPQPVPATPQPVPAAGAAPAPAPARIRMATHHRKQLSPAAEARLLKRPIVESADILARVRPIQEAVKMRGDAALLELTEKFDRVKLATPVLDLRAPGRQPVQLDPEVRAAIDLAMGNVRRFHEAQLPTTDLRMETMPGVECSRFARPIERVGLYVPGGTAVLPSTTYMLGVPAQVAGCQQIILASPPGLSGRVAPEVEYIADKVCGRAWAGPGR